VFFYKYSLIQSDPFADSGVLRELALNAMDIAFKTHARFVIGQGMLEMIVDATSSFRGNFKVEASEIVPTMYGMSSNLLSQYWLAF